MPVSEIANNMGETESKCYNLISCFWNLVNEGIRDGSGVASLFSVANNNNYDNFTNDINYFFGKLIIQLFYFMIITLVMLSVFGGIIIDTFSELREKLENFNHDLDHYCFICCLEKNQFQSKGINFVWHKSENHCKWKYVYLYSYLEDKHLSDCHDPTEFHIKNLILNNSVDFFPVKQSLQIQALQQENRREGSSSDKVHEFSFENYNFVLNQIFKTISNPTTNNNVDARDL